MGGGSLEMWKEYLGTGSQIIGIDINPDCKAYQTEGIDIFIGSQDDSATIDAIFSRYPKIDIVLDDGGHVMQQMITSFELMYDRLDANGVYIVEDMHTCYWSEYGGGLRRDDSFMEFAKRKLDEINAVYTRGALPVTEFTRSTNSVCFYDSMAVFERRRQGQRQAVITEGMQSCGAAVPGSPRVEEL